MLYFSVPELLESEFICEFAGTHRIGQVLFVGEHQEVSFAQFIFLKLEKQNEASIYYLIGETPFFV